MTDQSTRLKIGFDVQTADLAKANAKVDMLSRSVERLAKMASKVTGSGRSVLGGWGGTSGSSSPPVRDWQRGELKYNPETKQWDEVGKPGQARPTSRMAPLKRWGSIGIQGVSRGLGLGSLGGMAGMGGLAAGAVVGMALAKSIGEAKDYRLALDGVYKQLSLTAEGQANYSSSLEKSAHNLGMTRLELARIEKGYVGVAGAVQGVAGIRSQVDMAGGVARGWGIDEGQTINQFGGMAKSGAFGALAGDSGLAARDFAALLADAVVKGNMGGREGELIQSVHSLIGVQMQTLTRPENIGDMVGALGAMGATKDPGLMGAAGADLLSRVSSGIRNPGGGAFGQFVSMKMLGGKDIYDTKWKEEEGAFGPNKNLEKSLDYFDSNFGKSKQKYWNISQQWGISMHQAEGLDKVRGQLGSNEFGATSDRLAGIFGGGDEGAKKAGRVSADMFPILSRISHASTKDLPEILNDPRLKNLSADDKAGIMQSKDPISAALKTVAEKGITKTEGEELKSELAKISDTLTALGDGILKIAIPTLTAINAGIEILTKPFRGASDAVTAVTEFANKPAESADLLDEGMKDARYEKSHGAENDRVRDKLASSPTVPEQMAFLQNDLGYTRERAAAMVANAQYESGGNPDATPKKRPDGTREDAYGIFQWHPNRRENFRKKFGRSMIGSSWQDQYRFADYELNEGDEKGRAGNGFALTNNPYYGGRYLSKNFVRPFDRDGREADKRGHLATAIAQQMPVEKRREQGVGVTAAPAPQVDLTYTTNVIIDGALAKKDTKKSVGNGTAHSIYANEYGF